MGVFLQISLSKVDANNRKPKVSHVRLGFSNYSALFFHLQEEKRKVILDKCSKWNPLFCLSLLFLPFSCILAHPFLFTKSVFTFRLSVLFSAVFHNVDYSRFSRSLQFNNLLGFLSPLVPFSYIYLFVCVYIQSIYFSCFSFSVFKMNFTKDIPYPVSYHIHCLVDLITPHGFNSYLTDEMNNYTFYLGVSPGIEVEVLTIHIQIRERHRQRQRKDSHFPEFLREQLDKS